MDTEKVWSAFTHGCVAAGPDGCAFFAPTAAEIQENVDKIYASLRAHPIPVRTDNSFGLVDYAMMRRTIFEALFWPYAEFSALAQALTDLAAGNGTALFKLAERPSFKCGCDPSELRFEWVRDGGAAVRCNDGKRISGSYEDALAHYENMSKTTNWADVWQSVRLTCLWVVFSSKFIPADYIRTSLEHGPASRRTISKVLLLHVLFKSCYTYNSQGRLFPIPAFRFSSSGIQLVPVSHELLPITSFHSLYLDPGTPLWAYVSAL